MYICFAEYRIAPEHREQYLALAAGQLSGRDDMYLYEGTDQPNLFVEVWQAPTFAAAEQIKEERRSGRSSLAQITAWIPGGESKLHVWTFQPALR
jgi:hypothetical protein